MPILWPVDACRWVWYVGYSVRIDYFEMNQFNAKRHFYDFTGNWRRISFISAIKSKLLIFEAKREIKWWRSKQHCIESIIFYSLWTVMLFKNAQISHNHSESNGKPMFLSYIRWRKNRTGLDNIFFWSSNRNILAKCEYRCLVTCTWASNDYHIYSQKNKNALNSIKMMW